MYVHELEQLGIDAYIAKPVRRGRLGEYLLSLSGLPAASLQEPKAALPAAPATFALQTCALVVEDNRVNQLVTKRYLEKLGWRSDFACNGLEAVRASARTAYDIILMDCQMP